MMVVPGLTETTTILCGRVSDSHWYGYRIEHLPACVEGPPAAIVLKYSPTIHVVLHDVAMDPDCIHQLGQCSASTRP